MKLSTPQRTALARAKAAAAFNREPMTFHKSTLRSLVRRGMMDINGKITKWGKAQ